MYIYNDYHLIREHMQYIEDEKREINALLDWADQSRSECLSPSQADQYRRIHDDLYRLKKRMEGRIEILEEIIVQFRDWMDATDDEIKKILYELRQMIDD